MSIRLGTDYLAGTPDISGLADRDLSNLTRTGKDVIDGQWVSSQTTVAQSVSIAASTEVEYDISSYLPNDNYNYEVLFSLSVSTGSTSGDGLEVGVCSDKVYSTIRAITVITRTSATNNGACAYTIPVGTGRKLIIRNFASYSGTIRFFRVHAYRRIGTNS